MQHGGMTREDVRARAAKTLWNHEQTTCESVFGSSHSGWKPIIPFYTEYGEEYQQVALDKIYTKLKWEAPPVFHDVFLSHKQEHAQDLAKAFKEHCKDNFNCFLDRDFNGDLHRLVDIVGRSRCLVLFLTKDVFDSPWCMLELLSAVMNKVPIVLFKVEGHSMGEVGFPAKLEMMEFPGAEHIKGINVIKHNRDYFDSCMERVSECVRGHIATRSTPRSIKTSDEVYAEFEQLRQRRNLACSGLPRWKPLGSKKKKGVLLRSKST